MNFFMFVAEEVRRVAGGLGGGSEGAKGGALGRMEEGWDGVLRIWEGSGWLNVVLAEKVKKGAMVGGWGTGGGGGLVGRGSAEGESRVWGVGYKPYKGWRRDTGGQRGMEWGGEGRRDGGLSKGIRIVKLVWPALRLRHTRYAVACGSAVVGQGGKGLHRIYILASLANVFWRLFSACTAPDMRMVCMWPNAERSSTGPQPVGKASLV